jgi:hypothetical protein
MQATNIYFSKIVKLGDRLREINFRKLPGTEGQFHVDVTDDRGNRHMFILTKKDGEWISNANNAPSWLLLSENYLGQLIEQEMSL